MGKNLMLPTSVLRGISSSRQKLFSRLGVLTLSDLLYHFPSHHENRSNTVCVADAPSGEYAALILEVTTPVTSARIKSGRTGRAMTVQKLIASDETGGVKMTFFNCEFLKGVFTVGAKFRFYGVITGIAGSCAMTAPEYEI